jgi:hypothetical protein
MVKSHRVQYNFCTAQRCFEVRLQNRAKQYGSIKTKKNGKKWRTSAEENDEKPETGELFLALCFAAFFGAR